MALNLGPGGLPAVPDVTRLNPERQELGFRGTTELDGMVGGGTRGVMAMPVYQHVEWYFHNLTTIHG